MPAKKIDLEEKIILQKRTAVKRKVLFAVVLVALIGTANAVATMRAQNPTPAQKLTQKEDVSADVLGKATHIEQQSLGEVVEQTQGVIDDVSKQTDQIIDETKEHLTEKVDSAIYSTTIKPIVDKIESLPEAQQKHIQDAVCEPRE